MLPGQTVAVMFCDAGERYLSKMYDEAWMREQGFADWQPE
jgi:hypothetical protein